MFLKFFICLIKSRDFCLEKHLVTALKFHSDCNHIYQQLCMLLLNKENKHPKKKVFLLFDEMQNLMRKGRNSLCLLLQ